MELGIGLGDRPEEGAVDRAGKKTGDGAGGIGAGMGLIIGLKCFGARGMGLGMRFGM